MATFLSETLAPPFDLRTEYARDPLAVNAVLPRLSWLVPRGSQSAYQILCAKSRETLAEGRGDLWDSGLVTSSDSTLRAYGGQPLEAFARCYWKVRFWDEHDQASSWSEAAAWGVGPLRESDWRGPWIRLPSEDTREESVSPWFRTTFELDENPTDAVAFVTSAGYHELYVNGQKVSEAVLAPAVSDYSRNVLVNAHDISSLLRRGVNCVALWAGRGWHIADDGEPTVTPPGTRVRAHIRITTPSKTMAVPTGPHWTCAPSPYTTLGTWCYEQFGGERFDARLARPDWCLPTFDDSEWKQAECAPSPAPAMLFQSCPPNRIGERIPVIACERLGDDRYLLDFGTDLTGWLQCPLPSLAPGQRIVFEYADSGGGSFHQRDEFLSAGAPGEAFCGKFNYHGFRTVVVSGLGDAPPQDAYALLIESDLETAGTFECSNALFNRIHTVQRWTLRCLNLGGYLVDCPHRERLGYGAEGQASIDSAVCNFDMAAFYSKWLGDWLRCQDRATGKMPHAVPFREAGGGPVYGGLVNVLAWKMFLYYGDAPRLAEAYPAMQGYLAYLDSLCVGEIVQPVAGKWNFLGDWLAPQRGMEDDGAYWPPVDASMFFNSCYRVMLWQIQASAAEALGYTSDAARCRAKLATSRRAVHNAFYRTDTPMYVLDEQPYLAYALLCGIVPREVKARVEARLTQRITQACDYHVESGVLGTAYLIQYLLESGRSDLLYAMVSQTTYPGWGYMVEQGATTAWEQWNGNFSHIHGSYLSLDAWFFQGIAGIRPDPAAPGFKHIVVKPEVGGDLAWAKAEYLSIHGMIASHWHRDGGELVFDVTVPPNTTASIHIPGTGARCASASLPSARRQNRRSIFTAQPGSYRFVSREK